MRQSDTTTADRPGDERPRLELHKRVTVGLAAVTGALVTVPVLALMIAPAFLKQGVKEHDLGPVGHYPVGEFVIATFTSDPTQGSVSRRATFVRNNGFLHGQPSFTILSSRSTTTLACPVQPNAVVGETTRYKDVTLMSTAGVSAFGSPCHDAAYDAEGNATHGPLPRGLDRYSFSIRDGALFVGEAYSVSEVEGTGARAKIHRWPLALPGQKVGGAAIWLYPVQPPR